MDKVKIINTVGGAISRTGLKLKKYSPEILIVAGIIGTVTSTVMACKATTKISDILDKAKEDIDAIHVMHEHSEKENTIDYTDEDSLKDLTIVYAQTGVKLVKLYAPAIALGIFSLGSIVTSNRILRRNNVALAAAYATVDKGFKEYRKSVIDRFGDEVDRELRYGVRDEKVNTVVIDENGKEKKIKDTIKVVGRGKLNDYSFFFDESSPYWEKDGQYNRMFLLSQQQWANDKLRAQGYLFLNEVLESLGVYRTPQQIKMGQIVGWVYNSEKSTGDQFIDFGIFEAYRNDEINFNKDVDPKDRKNKDMYEKVLLLDFNVDGNILDLI